MFITTYKCLFQALFDVPPFVNPPKIQWFLVFDFHPNLLYCSTPFTLLNGNVLALSPFLIPYASCHIFCSLPVFPFLSLTHSHPLM